MNKTIIIYVNGTIEHADISCIYIPFFARKKVKEVEAKQANLQETKNGSNIPATEARDAQRQGGI